MVEKEPKRGRREVRVPELRRVYGDLDDEERLSLAANLFCKGKSPSHIQKKLSERFNETIRREEPYRLLQLAAALGYFQYRPPLEEQLGEDLSEEWDLSGAHVVQTAVLDDVTSRAAEVLLDLIQQEWAVRQSEIAPRRGQVETERDGEAGTIRIGLAGVRTVLKIVRSLVELLKREDPDDVPPALGFHTACTGIDYHDPSTDPNAFMTHLLRIPGIESRTYAVPYQAPPIMRPNVRAMLEDEPQMRRAARLFKEIDILVTAGSSWRIWEISGSGEIRPAPESHRDRAAELMDLDPDDPDRDPDGPDPLNTIYSQLKALMLRHDKRGYNRLIKAGTVADMLWQPLTFDGPAEVDTKVQAMTLAPLSGMPDFIDRGKKVLFVLGPYEGGFDKGDVLLAALGAEATADAGLSARPLFTHLVCDHRTARAVPKTVEH